MIYESRGTHDRERQGTSQLVTGRSKSQPGWVAHFQLPTRKHQLDRLVRGKPWRQTGVHFFWVDANMFTVQRPLSSILVHGCSHAGSGSPTKSKLLNVINAQSFKPMNPGSDGLTSTKSASLAPDIGVCYVGLQMLVGHLWLTQSNVKCYTLSPGLHKSTQTQTNINLHEQAYSCLERQCRLQYVSITNGCTSTLTRAIFSNHFNLFPTCGSSHHGHDPKCNPRDAQGALPLGGGPTMFAYHCGSQGWGQLPGFPFFIRNMSLFNQV